MATTAQRQGFPLAVALLIFPMVLSGTCVDGQRIWNFRQTFVGRLPKTEADASFNDAGTPQCARHCTDLLGPRCRAMALHQERRECRVYSSPQASEETVQAPGFQVLKPSQVREGSSPGTVRNSLSSGAQTFQVHVLFRVQPKPPAGMTFYVIIAVDESGLRHCREYFNKGYVTSGVYTLHLQDGGQPFQAYCDMTTAGGGWTVFQRRHKDGSVNFNQTWKGFKEGFGNVSGEHWLGNDLLHRLTAAGLTELRVDFKAKNSSTYFAHYANFTVGDELSAYALTQSGYTGNAGDALFNFHGDPWTFSTWDRDNDKESSRNCVSYDGGGWWHWSCWFSINGKDFRWLHPIPLQASEMKLR